MRLSPNENIEKFGLYSPIHSLVEVLAEETTAKSLNESIISTKRIELIINIMPNYVGYKATLEEDASFSFLFLFLFFS